MKNILTTIPRTKFKDWKTAERICRRCDGEDEYWLVNCGRLPTQSGIGAQCFMIYNGLIRGYFDIVDTDRSENWRNRHDLGRYRNTFCLVLANWHPIAPIACQGFQGYRYTALRPE